MDLAGPRHGVENLKQILSERGKPVVLHAGHRYNFVKKKKPGNTNLWCYNKEEW